MVCRTYGGVNETLRTGFVERRDEFAVTNKHIHAA